jgi:type II secretory pathway pseudopilin PulG
MKRNKGFTLFEAVVAIAVVTLLAGILIPMTVKYVHQARVAKAMNDMHVIGAAVMQQVADTGARPRVVAAGMDGTGVNVWYSNGLIPNVVNAFVPPAAGGPAGPNLAAVHPGNTFLNLFTAGGPVFNLGAPIPGQHAPRYRGPYLPGDVANLTDPWGRAYLILGYNAEGGRQDGPIWIVCAGPDNMIDGSNLSEPLRQQWNYVNQSTDDIAFRVH